MLPLLHNQLFPAPALATNLTACAHVCCAFCSTLRRLPVAAARKLFRSVSCFWRQCINGKWQSSCVRTGKRHGDMSAKDCKSQYPAGTQHHSAPCSSHPSILAAAPTADFMASGPSPAGMHRPFNFGTGDRVPPMNMNISAG
jgi:hypothetical protein